VAEAGGTGRWALVTGASAGIGAALCRVFAEHGYSVVLTARREDRMRDAAAQLERDHAVKTVVIAADLADRAAPEHIFARTEELGIEVAALVNNAGFGSRGNFDTVGWAEHAAFLQVMITSLVQLSHLYVPGMTKRGFGRILNVGSIAAFMPALAGRTLYGATKAFVVKFSEALAAEHRDDGVHVTAVCPGFTYTEFHDVVSTRDKVSNLPAWMWMDADTVARQAYDALEANRPLLVNGVVNTAMTTLLKLMPDAAARRLVSRQSRQLR
jgi:short-subunit dehydrogenase